MSGFGSCPGSVCVGGGLGGVCFWASSYAGLSNNRYINSSIYICSFNSCKCTASYTGSSIKEVNTETCLHFIMNNLDWVLLAGRKCDGHSVRRLKAILTLIVTGIYRLSSQYGEENVPSA